MSPLEMHDSGLHDLIAPDVAIERIAGGCRPRRAARS